MADRPASQVAVRAVELERARQLALRILAEGGCVEISGDAGIGKTSIWRSAVSACAAAGALVLRVAPVEDDDMDLELLGLRDLLAGQQVGQGAVLDAEVSPVDRGHLLLDWLRATAAVRPIVVAVDDLQWLDTASARTVRFALRRLDGARVGAVVSVRTGTPGNAAHHSLSPADRIHRVALGPMSRDDLREVVRARIGPLSAPEADRLHELSGGNPFAAIEIARRLRESGATWDLAGPVAVDGSLAQRLGALETGTRDVVEFVALAGPTHITLLQAVVGKDIRAALADAVAEGWLRVGSGLVVGFEHPLARAAAASAIPPVRRRDRHTRLAETVADPDARARHLALSATHADPATAATLEAAATRAARKGAPGTAATLMGHSIRLTPTADEPDATRRALAEVTLRAASGEPQRAVRLADRMIAALPAGVSRTTAILQRSYLDVDHSDEMLHRLIDGETDPLTRANLYEMLGLITGLYRGQPALGRMYADGALSMARTLGDQDLLVRAATVLSTVSVLQGVPRPDLASEAEALVGERGGPPLGRWPQIFRTRQDLWGGRLDRADQTFTWMQGVFAASGTEFQRPYRLVDLAAVALARGRLDVAAGLVQDGMDAAEDAQNESALAWLHWVGGTVDALRGDPDAEPAAAFLDRWGREHREPVREVMALDVRGQVDLAAGDPARAVASLVAAVERLSDLGFRHPGWLPVLPHAVEATAAAGERDQCRALVDELGHQAYGLRLPWVDAVALGARGHLALVDGDPTRAVPALAESAARLDGLGYVLDGARARLGQARALLRAGQRSSAADVLGAARGAFDQAGAHPWVARVDDELARLRITVPSVHALEVDRLTPTEKRIATLVVGGRRNREIGADLFISESTVEAHLTRTYRKLGIRSRASLGPALDRSPQTPHT